MTRLRALLERATPAPWTPSADEPGDVVLWGPTEEWMANIGNWARQHPEIDAKAAARQFCEFRDAADAELMAAMRDALPALLDAVDAGKRLAEETAHILDNAMVNSISQDRATDAIIAFDAALAKLK